MAICDRMRTLVKMQFGSHVYGTNTPQSDLDYKAIHLPDPREILLGCAKPSINTQTRAKETLKNGPEDIDFESFSLQKYMAMLLEGQTVALSMLYTPAKWWSETSLEWEFIQNNKAQWLHRNVAAFAGYCRQQANKYGIRGSRIASVRKAVEILSYLIAEFGNQSKLKEHWDTLITGLLGLEHIKFIDEAMKGRPEIIVRMVSICDRKVQEHVTLKEAYKIYLHVFEEYGQRALAAEKNEGIDWKACMHAMRVSHEAEELLTTGRITYPRPEAELLLQIRKGELPYKQVAEMLENRLELLEICSNNSSLPEKGNAELAESFIIASYKSSIWLDL